MSNKIIGGLLLVFTLMLAATLAAPFLRNRACGGCFFQSGGVTCDIDLRDVVDERKAVMYLEKTMSMLGYQKTQMDWDQITDEKTFPVEIDAAWPLVYIKNEPGARQVFAIMESTERARFLTIKRWSHGDGDRMDIKIAKSNFETEAKILSTSAMSYVRRTNST